jgi:hypothetical protein
MESKFHGNLIYPHLLRNIRIRASLTVENLVSYFSLNVYFHSISHTEADSNVVYFYTRSSFTDCVIIFF